MHEPLTPEPAAGRATDQLYDNESTGPQRAQTRAQSTNRRLLAFVLIGLGLAMLVTSGPSVWRKPQSHTVNVPNGNVETARVDLAWGSGSLEIEASQNEEMLITGDIRGRAGPFVDVDREGSNAEVTLRDRREGLFFAAGGGASGHLRLSRDPLYHFKVDAGSGRLHLDLRQLNVADLTLDAGSGAAEILLPTEGSTSVEVDGASGYLHIDLPEDKDARVVVDEASGSFRAGEPLKRVAGEDGDEAIYETPGYAQARERVEITIDGGSGDIAVD